jgi:hypothetical protein
MSAKTGMRHPLFLIQLCSYAGGGDSPDRLDALVYCLTELMSASNTTGIIDYYRELCEAGRDLAEAAVPGSAAAQKELATTTFRAPEGLSDLFTLSGRHIAIGVDRLVRVSARDALALRQASWQEVAHVPLT